MLRCYILHRAGWVTPMHAALRCPALFTSTMSECTSHVQPAVPHHGSVGPPLQLDPQYRSLARNRSQAAGRKTRVMQVIDDPRNLLLRPMPVGYTKRKVEFCPGDSTAAISCVVDRATLLGGHIRICSSCKPGC